MAISIERIRADIEAIARCTETPGEGATRPTFSRAWGEARAYVIAQAEAAGCNIGTDAAGNIHARRCSDWGVPGWSVGSHIDTVPHGGDYDGVAGIVVGLELLRSQAEDAISSFRPPIELIVFAEEEGPTFGLGMLGSRAWVGELTVDQLAALRNSQEQTYWEAGAPYGVDRRRLPEDIVQREHHLGFIEVHIEQGPGMWRHDQRLAVVRAIAGRRQYRVTVCGEANHAGATSMSERKDALAGAAEMVTALEDAVKQLSPDAVLTVGRVEVKPNAVNVIAQRVDFTIDFRAPDDELLRRGDAMLRAVIGGIVEVRGLQADVEQTEGIAARAMNRRLVDTLSGNGELPLTVSGALHDSAVLAPHVPTVMLFVPSKDGISHNPAEFSRVEDIAAAAEVVERLVRRPTLATVNGMSRDAFVAVCGPFFEHSPWIAERAWAKRPFASLAQLHETMCGVVRSVTADEQLSLIRAHPDLIGRLAREGRLTRESTGEQAAAGLNSLSADEIAAFEQHNAAYRERFGFPFIICARENRKDAILAAFPARLRNSREQEIATAVVEIDKIAKLRINDAIWEA